MIVDWNNNNKIRKGQVFHFKHSLEPYINICDAEGNSFILNIHTMTSFSLEDIINNSENFQFYTDEENEDFMGVEIDGRIMWVDD